MKAHDLSWLGKDPEGCGGSGNLCWLRVGVDAPAFAKVLIDDEGDRLVGNVLQKILAFADGDVDILRDSILDDLLSVAGVEFAFEVADNVVVAVARGGIRVCGSWFALG